MTNTEIIDIIKDAAFFGGNIKNKDLKECIYFFDNVIEKQLNLPVVNRTFKEKHTQTFDDWLQSNCKNYGFAGYLYKDKLVNRDYLFGLYKKEQNNQP